MRVRDLAAVTWLLLLFAVQPALAQLINDSGIFFRLASFRAALNDEATWRELSSLVERQAVLSLEAIVTPPPTEPQEGVDPEPTRVEHVFRFGHRKGRSSRAYELVAVVDRDAESGQFRVQPPRGRWMRLDPESRTPQSDEAVSFWSRESLEALRFLVNDAQFAVLYNTELETQSFRRLTIRHRREFEPPTDMERYDLVFAGPIHDASEWAELRVAAYYDLKRSAFVQFQVIEPGEED